MRIADVPHLAEQIRRHRALLADDPALAAVFLLERSGPDETTVIRQPDLATTLERVAAEGTAAFYAGAIAEAIASTVQERGGVLTIGDLAAYRPVWRTPLTGRFKTRRIVTFPPPGSGAIVLATLGIVANDDLWRLGRGSRGLADLLTGAMSRAFQDRARYFGDPDFTEIPLDRLLDPERLLRIRAELARAGRPAAPPGPDAGTAHVSVVDGDGNAVSLTTTINTAFGAGILVPGTGIILNNEMDDFVVAPGKRNLYGLGGGTANVLAPGKRPQSSMSPTIVLEGERPALVLGGSGGPFIISAVAQVVLDHVVFGSSPITAITAGRLHDQGAPTPLLTETRVSEAVREHFRGLGYPLRSLPALGAVSAVGLRADGIAVAAGDARKHGGIAVAR